MRRFFTIAGTDTNGTFSLLLLVPCCIFVLSTSQAVEATNSPVISERLLPLHQAAHDKDRRLSLSNIVYHVIDPALSKVGMIHQKMVNVELNSAADKSELDTAVEDCRKQLIESLRPAAEAGNASAQFYYARGLHSLFNAYNLLRKDATGIANERKRFAQAAAEQDHPGACELMAWLSTNPVEEKKWRRKGAELGCITSLSEMALSTDYGAVMNRLYQINNATAKAEKTLYFDTVDDAYYFMVLDLLVDIHWHQPFQPHDQPFMSDLADLARYELVFPLDKDRKPTSGRVGSAERRAVEDFQKMKKDYLIGEVNLVIWQ